MRRVSFDARPPRASSCPRSAAESARWPVPPRVAARSNSPEGCSRAAMRILRSLAPAVALATAGVMVFLLGACGHTLVAGGPHTMPGSGPGGKPMTTVTEQAVGIPPVPKTIIYPVTARIVPSDKNLGTKVGDPYRWLENLDSPEVRTWVAAQNDLSGPRLAELPARPWVKARLTQ